MAVTPICFGTSPLASMAQLYGYAVEAERAVATVLAIFESPVNFLDTSNGYGENGTAERRIGEAIRRTGGLPSQVVLATKVDPDPRTGDFSGDRVRVSLEESMERLGIDKVALLHLHDPERMSFEEGVAPGGPVEALVDLREHGPVEHLGVAGGPVGLLQQYLDTGEFEVVLSHNRYTLLDRSAEPLLQSAADRGLGVLTRRRTAAACCRRVRACSRATRTDPEMIGSGKRQRRWRLPVGGMASRSPPPPCSSRCGSEMIDSTVVGVSSPERITQTLELAAVTIPDELWPELERLTPPQELWLY
jgi:D-threo-aldose 1-dehydrogenase